MKQGGKNKEDVMTFLVSFIRKVTAEAAVRLDVVPAWPCFMFSLMTGR